MYTKFNNLSEQFNQIRHKNEELEKENSFKERQQHYIRKAEDLFMKKYMRTVSMNKWLSNIKYYKDSRLS